jgi:carbon-monoxide dehydrogenase medium subunit
VIPGKVDYVRPGTVEEALQALGQPDAKVIAGGQSLLPLMKLRLAQPSILVDVSRLDLGGIDTGGGLRIGALATWADLARSQELAASGYAALSECAGGIGDLQIRNRGTFGGGLAHGDPASDMPAVALALGAELHLRSASGERTVAATDFFVGPFETALGEDELFVAATFAGAPDGSAYVSVEQPASGFALAGAAAAVHNGSAAVAVTGATARPTLLSGASEPELLDAARGLDVTGDRYAPEEYRRALVEVVVKRALASASARARGEAA